MKEYFNDIEFKQLLQGKAHKAGENKWFTPKVLNRLPEKDQSTDIQHIEKWCYCIGMVLCCLFWIILSTTGYFDIITVRSLIYITCLSIGSLFLAIQTIRTVFS